MWTTLFLWFQYADNFQSLHLIQAECLDFKCSKAHGLIYRVFDVC